MRLYTRVCTVLAFLSVCACHTQQIDRKALVSRHNITQTRFDAFSALTVGNGEFAFTADLTGMQTFPLHYEKGITLGTQSQWGWHAFPNVEGYELDEVKKPYLVGADSIDYVYQFKQGTDARKVLASEWLRENPHRLHLGLIGLEVEKSDHTPLAFSDIQNARQELNLWKGTLHSYFEIEGIPVAVTTVCHQEQDIVAFKIQSAWINKGALKVKLQFPFVAKGNTNPGYDFSSEDLHQSTVLEASAHHAVLRHQIDTTTYYATVCWNGTANIEQGANHTYLVAPKRGHELEFCVRFSPDPPSSKMPHFAHTAANSALEWAKFWKSGAAVDFEGSTDPRAFELERRIVLSQYLTKIQCSGSLPAQETGLTENSWYGKFHMEMYWWHAAHFILWNRPELAQQSMPFYFTAYPKAKSTAQQQGYEGARWQKMTGPTACESPSTVGPFLIWQQPHLIYLVDLLYRCHHRDPEILKQYQELIEGTADFMASYARWDSLGQRYVLGPALNSAQERFDPVTTLNPSFELAYWHWGLQTAQKMRVLQHLPPKDTWQNVIDGLADLPVSEDTYLFAESAPDSYTNPKYLTDHPIIMGVLGFLPVTEKVDVQTLERSFYKANQLWDWDSCWGWDFPLACMCATMLQKPEMAIDLLLMDSPKNHYFVNGHNYQRETLTLYLPGNGALLTAVSLLCTYRDQNGRDGFPQNGQWNVKYENMMPLHEGQ